PTQYYLLVIKSSYTRTFYSLYFFSLFFIFLFCFFFFFLMIRRPPRSTLFPTRRSSDLQGVQHQDRRRAVRPRAGRGLRREQARRSEEHTSELQSPCNLVCRLLLEKKKKTKKTLHTNHQHIKSTTLKANPNSTTYTH